MIYSFGGRNFYSFRTSFSVDFRVQPQAGEREIFHSDTGGRKTNAVMAVFGANASGKTHLLKVLGFLQWFIVRSAQSKPDDASWSPMAFRFTDTPDPVTDLFMEFEMGGEHYRYELSLDDSRVRKESLQKKKIRFATLFEREWTGEGYRFKSQNFGDNASQVPLRHNASFISTALLLENTMARRLDAFFSACYANVWAFGRNDRNDPLMKNLFSTAKFFNENREHLDWVNRRLANFDLGLNEILIQKLDFPSKDGKQEERFIPFGIHRHGESVYDLPLFEESRGTQALFVLLRHILPVLKSGGIAFIDEFEMGLHSHMIPVLVDLFYTRKHNKKGAQLIFSCHSDYILTQLEKYQIQIVNKDDAGTSTTCRLDEIRGIRNVDNLYAKYHAGAYGGVPGF